MTSGKLKQSKEIYPPDPKVRQIPEGRYNHFGQSVFYLAETEDGAAREILKHKEKMAWLQKFSITVDNILDFSFDITHEPEVSHGLDILAFGLTYDRRILSKEVHRSKGWKPEYFVPRYIADCAKVNGCNGIKFMSTKHYANNLVLFNWSSKLIKPRGKAKLHTVKDVYE